jgi:hypothetical protein
MYWEKTSAEEHIFCNKDGLAVGRVVLEYGCRWRAQCPVGNDIYTDYRCQLSEDEAKEEVECAWLSSFTKRTGVDEYNDWLVSRYITYSLLVISLLVIPIFVLYF